MKIHYLIPLSIILSLPSVSGSISDNPDEVLPPPHPEESQLDDHEDDNTLNLYEEMEQEEIQSNLLEQDDPEKDFFPLEEETTSDF